ncbi:MAG: hypothetical protein EPO21_12010 [Chloroflexota bacterium]|nr:MAG: hypothetical protein EPO21_12010 [Chloroflexota bacterium]
MDPGGIPHYFGPYPNYANSPMPKGAVANLTLDDGGSGYSAPLVSIVDVYGTGSGASASATVDPATGAINSIALANGGSDYTAPVVIISDPTGEDAAATATIGGPLTGGIRKFVDSLPGLGAANKNTLDQYIPVAVPDTTTYPPGGKGYTSAPTITITDDTGTGATATARIAGGAVTGVTVTNAGSGYSANPAVSFSGGGATSQAIGVATVDRVVGSPTFGQITAITLTGADYYEIELGEYTEKLHSDLPPTTLRGYRQTNTSDPNVSKFHYLGPTVVAQRNKPVRVKFTNKLPTGTGGDLFLPVDSTVMGAGTGPNGGTEKYKENRGTLHLHGGFIPWISDGTPQQWITPAGEATPYPKGVAVQNVPDMSDPGPGSMTFYYNNQQSARLMFYHDHAFGITRLNVYAGEAAPYVLTDQVEKDLINGTNQSGVNPEGKKVLPDLGIPLVIQDKSFVDPATIATQDPTWNWGTGPIVGGKRTPKAGDLWYPHVYMPNQNPSDLSGMNAFGRWHYGPWFWPPTTNITHGPVPNPFYDPVNAPWEPKTMPGTPNPSEAAEAFMDTPLVNGTAYPYLVVDPKAYRFRMLNAADDRFFNLQLYQADPDVTTADGRKNTEVKMVPSADGREGGIPDPSTAGPSFIQIGTEGGFLPAPIVLPNKPVEWNFDQTNFDFGLVKAGTLILGTAERADVIVDFSAFAGKTLILYDDAPAPFPAIDPRYDYYTDNPGQTDIGGTPTTQPGYGPNTRTIMQIKVNPVTPAPTYDLSTLRSVFAKTAAKGGVFDASQDQIIVPNANYNSAYNKTLPADTYVRIMDNSQTFQTLSGQTVTIPLQPKAIQDEMGEAFDPEYGRMSAMLGLELPKTTAGAQNFMLYPYLSPPVELIKGSVYGTPIGSLNDGTQIWKITHNGVDTHTIHFHLFNVQLINRVAWDNALRLPDSNELGWKETVRVNPLQDTIVALRPIKPTQPFQVPGSVRLIDPTKPEGAYLANSTQAEANGLPPQAFDPNGEPVDIINHKVNYGWEYVYHCHLLAHEEFDMMHSVVLAFPPNAPSNLKAAVSGNRATLTWSDNSIDETGFTIQRAADAGFTTGVVSSTVASNVTTYADTITPGQPYFYRVVANNMVGDTWDYTDPNLNEGASFPHFSADSAFSNMVAINAAAPVIATTSLPNGQVGIAYSQTLAVGGGVPPYTWSLSVGILPAGLTLDPATGVISGTPTTASTRYFTVQVVDSAGVRNARQLSLTVSPALTVTTTSLPNGQVGRAYSQTLAASGGTTPYTSWSLSAGALPAGLTLNASTGAISGTPLIGGTSNFTVMVTDSVGGTATRALSITVAAGPLTITTTSLPNGQVGVAYSQTLAAAGGTPPYTWSLSGGVLPAGLTLDLTTGVISGTPATAGARWFTVQVVDSAGGRNARQLSINITPSLAVTTASLPNGQVGRAYRQTLAATGGTTPYTWSLSDGELPDGLTLNASAGVISGTPTTAGTSNFTVMVTDSTGGTATRALSITVAAGPLTITTASLPNGQVGVAYSQTLAAVGGMPPYTWSLSVGILPAGLTLDPATGVISGTPTTASTRYFTVQVVDSAGGRSAKLLSITIR